ncbi:hypothetical protein [uncultured Succinatimonas sp.]
MSVLRLLAYGITLLVIAVRQFIAFSGGTAAGKNIFKLIVYMPI